MRASFAAATAVAVAIGVAGCSQQDSPQEEHGTANIVASTDVWGSVARAVAGGHATVTSILDSPVDDPHSYEATPANAAAIADASVVVFNGGDYDHWVEDVLANNPDVPTVDAYSLLGDPAPHANEHVFYDLSTASAVAARIADQLGKADSGNADNYRANAAEFARKADEILTLEQGIGQAHPGASVVATEPVAHYLLVNGGITDKTPEGFANAIEEDTDPSPADLAAMLDLISTAAGVGSAVQPSDRDRGNQTASGRRRTGLDSGGDRDGDPAGRHRLSDLAAPDRRTAGEPVG